MHKAAFDDNTYVLTFLKEQTDMKIDELDLENNTPLHFACDKKNEFAIQWLLSFGADINAKNAIGETPLHIYIKNVYKIEKIKSLKDLLINGASRTEKN